MSANSESLIQAAHMLTACIHILTECIGADMTHPMDFNLNFPLETADCLIREVLEHRSDEERCLAKPVPGRPAASATEQLMQPSAILAVCIMANHNDPRFHHECDLSYPMHAALTLIDQARVQIDSDRAG
jgi:hypothetical protein